MGKGKLSSFSGKRGTEALEKVLEASGPMPRLDTRFCAGVMDKPFLFQHV